MPTYEYECQECGHKFELFLPIKGNHKRKCSKCKTFISPNMGTGSAIIFKGSGFYKTDYPKGKKEKRSEESDARKEGKTVEKGSTEI